MSYLDKYRKPNGYIDWDQLRAAELAAGGRCVQCDGVIHHPTGVRSLCTSCSVLDIFDDEVTHGSMIRCPGCGHPDHVEEWDSDRANERYVEGEHWTRCPACGLEHTFETHVSYSYTSPQRKVEK